MPQGLLSSTDPSCTALAEDEGAENLQKKTIKVPGEEQHRSFSSYSASLYMQSRGAHSDPFVQAAPRLSRSRSLLYLTTAPQKVPGLRSTALSKQKTPSLQLQ